MTDLTITTTFSTAVEPSPTAGAVAAAFGIGLDTTRKFTLIDNLHLVIDPGRIVYITGPSGSGKSTLVKILKRHLDNPIDLDAIRFKPKTLLPDHFPKSMPLNDALYYLSLTGLADAFIFLRTPRQLSDGQRYRFRLALALARTPRRNDPVILADNFLDNVDRITAHVIAHNIRKFAQRFNTTFILASAHDDLHDTLKPHITIEKDFGAETRIAHHR